jgi:hypothetical protein
MILHSHLSSADIFISLSLLNTLNPFPRENMVYDYWSQMKFWLQMLCWSYSFANSSLQYRFHSCVLEKKLSNIFFHLPSSLNSKAIPPRPASAKGERKYSSYSSLTSALDGVSGQRHAPAALYPRELIPSSHWIRGWVGLRTGLDTQAREK